MRVHVLGPHASCQVRVGQILLAIDGQTFDSLGNVRERINGPIGSTVTLTLQEPPTIDGKILPPFHVPMIRTALAQTPTVRCIIRHRVGWLALLSSHHTDVPGDAHDRRLRQHSPVRAERVATVATKDNLLQPHTACCNDLRRWQRAPVRVAAE